MDINALLIAMGSMGGLGALFSIGLAIADKKLHVEEDPRIAKIVDYLPGANCGACGLPGCGAFADQLVSQKVEITGCPVNTPESTEAIASILGVEAVQAEKKVARVMCQGGDQETAKKGIYYGVESCIAAHLNGGGDKLCEWGCIGFGDCIASCPFDAMYLDDNHLIQINEDKCTGCGKCVVSCPRHIIEVHPQNLNLFVLCASQDEARYAKTVCTKACGGCGACAKGAEKGHIVMQDFHPTIDHTFGPVEKLPTEKCPTKALVLLNNQKDT